MCFINIIMTWSKWKTPATIAQDTDEGIDFTDGDGVLDQTTDLQSIALLYASAQDYNDRVNTYGSKGLIYTNFGFDAGVVDRVELLVEAQRYSRIQDDRVQLRVLGNGGTDVSDLSTENVKTYSGLLGAYWGMEDVDVAGMSFGALIDFAPRNDMPSSNNLIVRKVQMRVHYSS
jgi:hypothetical protein